MSFVFDGQRIETPGIESVCWLDDPKVPRATDGRVRGVRPMCIVLHTVHGRSGVLHEGSKPSTRAEVYAKYQARTSREVSWHATVDVDGTVVQSADFGAWTCWHAPPTNPWSIGIEMVQDDDGGLYRAGIDACVALCTLLCGRFAIPRRVPVDAHGQPFRRVVPAWQSVAAGGKAERFGGVLGHRNVTQTRGAGDPGDHIFNALLAAGYEGVVPV